MTMVDAGRSDEIYAELGPGARRHPADRPRTPRSASPSFGGKAAFIGRIADDTFGKVFAHDLRARRRGVRRRPRDRRVADRSVPRDRRAPTPSARCARTSARAPRSTRSTSTPIASRARRSPTSRATSGTVRKRKDAIRRAATLAKDAGRKVALTLSDPFCVRSPPCGVPRADRVGASTCCSPTKTRSPRSTRSTRSTTRPGCIAARLRDRRAHSRCQGFGRDQRRVSGTRSPRSRSSSWSTRPAPVTSTRRDFSTA